jgi:hypothetical protein
MWRRDDVRLCTGKEVEVCRGEERGGDDVERSRNGVMNRQKGGAAKW